MSNEGHLLKFKRALALEIDTFITYFSSKETIQSDMNNTTSFWLRSRYKLPILFELTIKTLCLPASSAYIERFFSICGVVCKNRAMNMKDELIIIRCLLKSNLKWLEELNISNCETSEN